MRIFEQDQNQDLKQDRCWVLGQDQDQYDDHDSGEGEEQDQGRKAKRQVNVALWCHVGGCDRNMC